MSDGDVRPAGSMTVDGAPVEFGTIGGQVWIHHDEPVLLLDAGQRTEFRKLFTAAERQAEQEGGRS